MLWRSRRYKVQKNGQRSTPQKKPRSRQMTDLCETCGKKSHTAQECYSEASVRIDTTVKNTQIDPNNLPVDLQDVSTLRSSSPQHNCHIKPRQRANRATNYKSLRSHNPEPSSKSNPKPKSSQKTRFASSSVFGNSRYPTVHNI